MKIFFISILLIVALLCGVSENLAQQRKPAKQSVKTKLPDSLLNLPRLPDSLKSVGVKKTNDSANPFMADIMVLSRRYADSVVLRWAVSTAGGWHIAKSRGFRIYRMELTDSMKIDTTKGNKLITGDSAIMPWSINEWKRKGGETNNFKALAAQALYGKDFSTSQDNGTESILNRMSEFETRWSFAMLAADIDAEVADGLALRFVDKNVLPNKRYVYSVVAGYVDSAYYFEPGYTMTNSQPDAQFAKPASINYDRKSEIASLVWSARSVDGNIYSGFVLERANPNGNLFERVNKEPIIYVNSNDSTAKTPEAMQGMVRFQDTIEKYKEYKYRVRGITPFGDLSEPSDVITVQTSDHTPPQAPILISAVESSPHEITVNWRMQETPNDLKGFYVARGYKANGPFTRLNKEPLYKEALSFVDKNPKIDTTNYYVVIAEDTSGNISESFAGYGFMVDSLPPAKPLGLKGVIDTNGVVTLTWNKNKERDVMGYRVYRTNSTEKGYEFIQVTKAELPKENKFIDTINVRTLTREVFYKVVAVDRNFNNSDFSDELLLKRPDLLPPVAPVFSNLFVTDTAVYLEWNPSTSWDVKSHQLFRRVLPDTVWKPIGGILSRDSKSYTDRDVKKKITYEYSLQATDSTGLKSDFSVPMNARPYDNGVRQGVTNLQIKTDTLKKIATLTWSYPQNKSGEKMRFIIYRSIGSSPLTQYTAVTGEKREWIDNEATKGGKYEYAVKVVFSQSGGESSVSQSVTANMGYPKQ